MKIAVLSGKGGTGKTTVAASLAFSLAGSQYIDCDVEEPNGALFLRPANTEITPVNVLVPTVSETECTGCGECAKACRFNAIAVIKGRVLLFPELCHHCGACSIACPQKAVTETGREIGVIECGAAGSFLQGRLNIGEPVTIPIIHKLKECMRKDGPVILDCPPGAACAVVQAADGCDYCILVTEPTPFGLHDLKIAVSLVSKMGILSGVVLNKAMETDQSIQAYCSQENIPLLMEIPYSRDIAESYSNGVLPVHTDASWKNMFVQMYYRIKRETEEEWAKKFTGRDKAGGTA